MNVPRAYAQDAKLAMRQGFVNGENIPLTAKVRTESAFAARHINIDPTPIHSQPYFLKGLK